jgi:hypothetical protein
MTPKEAYCCLNCTNVPPCNAAAGNCVSCCADCGDTSQCSNAAFVGADGKFYRKWKTVVINIDELTNSGCPCCEWTTSQVYSDTYNSSFTVLTNGAKVNATASHTFFEKYNTTINTGPYQGVSFNSVRIAEQKPGSCSDVYTCSNPIFCGESYNRTSTCKNLVPGDPQYGGSFPCYSSNGCGTYLYMQPNFDGCEGTDDDGNPMLLMPVNTSSYGEWQQCFTEYPPNKSSTRTVKGMTFPQFIEEVHLYNNKGEMVNINVSPYNDPCGSPEVIYANDYDDCHFFHP